MIPLGIGLGIFQSPNNSAIMGAVPRERLGVASGLLSLSRTLGQASGVPLMGTLFITLVFRYGRLPSGTSLEIASPEALVSGIAGTYRIAALIILTAPIMAVSALWVESRRRARAGRIAWE